MNTLGQMSTSIDGENSGEGGSRKVLFSRMSSQLKRPNKMFTNNNTNINTNAKDINTKKNVQQNNPKIPDLENKVNKFNEYRHLLSADELDGVDGIYLVQEFDELSNGARLYASHG
jgi:hypothetical protein